MGFWDGIMFGIGQWFAHELLPALFVFIVLMGLLLAAHLINRRK